MTLINLREPIPVKIGLITLYCEKMSLSAKTITHIAPTVLGVAELTNKCRQMTHLTFSGRVYDTSHPLRLSLLMNNRNGQGGIEIIYKDMKFLNCMMTGIDMTDAGKDYIELTVRLSTLSTGTIYDG